MPVKKLRPIRGLPREFEELEALIKKVLRRELYHPLLSTLIERRDVLENAPEDELVKALQRALVTYKRGLFTGTFSAEISRALRSYGAVWDHKAKGYRLPKSKLPREVKTAVDLGLSRFQARMERLRERLRKILPEKIAESVNATPLFDSALFRVDRQLRETTKAFAVLPELSASQRERLSAEWSENLDLWIKDWSASEILKLRKDVERLVRTGARQETLVKLIQKSYGVASGKAKFLARQETNLLLTKFKETRYQDAGIREYTWRCVVGSPAHPVRPSHKALDGRTFRFDQPPVTTAPGQPARRNNPGQDYNCRCYAVPIVRF